MGMVVFPIAVLLIVGLFYNNLTAGGAFTVANASGNCNGASPAINCAQYPGANPCAQQTNCQLGQLQLLNKNSPFTYLFAGDISGFLTSMFSSGQSNSLNALSVCYTRGGQNPATGGSGVTFLHCSSSSWQQAGPPVQQYPLVSCNNLDGQGSKMGTGFNATGSGAGYNASGANNVNQWTIYGCQPANQVSTNPNNQTGTLTIIADYSGANGSVVLTKYKPGLFDLFSAASGGSNFIVFFGFIIGIILFIMSFGIGFNGSVGLFGGNSAGGGFTTNPQGTKLAQTFGLGLLIWTPLYSEFGGWINAQTLGGYGLDIIINFALFICVFLGFYSIIGGMTSGEE